MPALPPTHPRSDTAEPVSTAAYGVRLAAGAPDLRAAQALRFEVFNVELDEGLPQSWDSGLDEDPFDAVCDHLLVTDADGSVVGTYRMQTGLQAGGHLGYYSAHEFDFRPFEAMRPQMLELGRACIALRHRNFAVLNLLWKGIAAYAQQQGVRYLVGCSSLTSQDEAAGLAAFRELSHHLAPPAWRTLALPAYACSGPAAAAAPKIPRLLSAYLALGARICSPPAIDREFRTIDLLTWLDIESPQLAALRQRGRFVG
jgi:putative hemolysin